MNINHRIISLNIFFFELTVTNNDLKKSEQYFKTISKAKL